MEKSMGPLDFLHIIIYSPPPIGLPRYNYIPPLPPGRFYSSRSSDLQVLVKSLKHAIPLKTALPADPSGTASTPQTPQCDDSSAPESLPP